MPIKVTAVSRDVPANDLRGNQIYGAFVLNHRVGLHAIDATPARWRGDAGSSPPDRARTEHLTHWLISTQVAIIEDAEKRGELKPGMTVVEATSGNTGIAVAMVCAQRGYDCVICMAEPFSVERRRLMRMLGAKVIVTPKAGKGTGQCINQKLSRFSLTV